MSDAQLGAFVRDLVTRIGPIRSASGPLRKGGEVTGYLNSPEDVVHLHALLCGRFDLLPISAPAQPAYAVACPECPLGPGNPCNEQCEEAPAQPTADKAEVVERRLSSQESLAETAEVVEGLLDMQRPQLPITEQRMLNRAIALLSSIPEDGWMPVSDGLPTDDLEKQYWVAVDLLKSNGEVVKAACREYYFYGGDWFPRINKRHERATHWQPLPAAPKEHHDER